MANIQFGKQSDDGMGKPAHATGPGKAAPGQPQGKDPNLHPAVKNGDAPAIPNGKANSSTGQTTGQMPPSGNPQDPDDAGKLGAKQPAKQAAMPQVNPQEAQMLREAAQILAKFGRGQDTILAHVTPEEVEFLKRQGGSGTTNPVTGLLEFGQDYSGPPPDNGYNSIYGTTQGGYYGMGPTPTPAPTAFNPYSYYGIPQPTTTAPAPASAGPAAGSGVPGSPAVPATPLTPAVPAATPSTPAPAPTANETSIANPGAANNNPYGASQYGNNNIGQQGAMGRAGSYGTPSAMGGIDPYTQTQPSNPLQSLTGVHQSAPDVFSGSGTPSTAGSLASTPGAPSGNALQGAAGGSSSTGAGSTAAVGTGNTDLLSMFLAGQNNQGGTYSG